MVNSLKNSINLNRKLNNLKALTDKEKQFKNTYSNYQTKLLALKNKTANLSTAFGLNKQLNLNKNISTTISNGITKSETLSNTINTSLKNIFKKIKEKATS